MAVIMPLMVVATPQVQPRTLETGTERTISSEEENSQLLDAFLESCTETAPTHLAPANAVSVTTINSTILTLPLSIIRKFLRNLLTSSTPLILQHDFITIPGEYRTHVEPKVLQVCKIFHTVGVPILYGENTFTTSSPATSFDFDEHILSLSGSKRQMITDIKLEIDWADKLWAKFPLVARALVELKGLLKLEIAIVEKEEMVEKKRTASIEKDANLKIMITYSQTSPSKDKGARQRAPATDRADSRMKRKGPAADVMLKAEMKMLKDLVIGIKRLKYFRLLGFRHELFARCLEEQVLLGHH